MKNQRIFPGVILIGFGTYIFLQQFEFPALQPFYSWPTLLIIIGIAFLGQGYSAKDYEAILPGVLFAGFGLHFHIAGHLAIWPTNTVGMLVFLISIGYFLRFQKTNTGLFQAFLFLVLAFLLLFYDKVIGYLDFLQTGMNFITKFWPAIIIFIGIYLLFKKKK